MDTRKETRVHQASFDTDPSMGLVDTVAAIKGVSATELDTLHRVVDVDALCALVDPPSAGRTAVSFRYEGCDVRVTSDGTIEVWEPIRAIRNRLGEAAHVLVLAPTNGSHDEELCVDLLAPDRVGARNVLCVTCSSSTAPGALETGRDGGLANVGLIRVGDFARSASAGPEGGTSPSRHVRTDTVPNPRDLGELGVRIGQHLEAWHGNGNPTVACVRTLSPLLEHVDVRHVFRFLHVLLGRLSASGATSHFHVDPGEHDRHTVETIAPLFDAVVEMNEAGDWTVRNGDGT